MAETQPIEMAPRDGTVIEATNDILGRWVDARWANYRSPTGRVSKQWVVVKDSGHFPAPAGTLMFPKSWRAKEHPHG